MQIEITTGDRVEIIDVTEDVVTKIPNDIETGICMVFVPHTTAGVIVNENEPRLISDIKEQLDRSIPTAEQYNHDQIDGNADAHLRALLLGESVSLPIVDGSLDLGTWQSILFVECDGPRSRNLTITVLAP